MSTDASAPKREPVDVAILRELLLRAAPYVLSHEPLFFQQRLQALELHAAIDAALRGEPKEGM